MADLAAVDVVALVLAGGESSRMGQDKALVLWEGVPLLQRVCQVAADCCHAVYVLTPRQESYQPIVPNVQWITETQVGQGPLVALLQGLAQIPTAWVLVLACDLPCLQVEVLQHWATQLPQLPDYVLALVPRYANQWEPLCAFYRSSAQSSLQSFVQQGGRSFQPWLAQNPVKSIAVDPNTAVMLRNCNTPEDLVMGNG